MQLQKDLKTNRAKALECLFGFHKFEVYDDAEDRDICYCGVERSRWSGRLLKRDFDGKLYYYEDLVSGLVTKKLIGETMDNQEKQLSSVSLSRNAKGAVQIDVKVYNESPDLAKTISTSVYDELCKQYPYEGGK